MKFPGAILFTLLGLGCGATSMDAGQTEPPDAGAPPDLGAPLDMGTPDSGAISMDAGPPDLGAPSCTASPRELVTLLTEDDVSLVADFYNAGVASGPAAVLLHMLPPNHDRSNYSPAFINALLDRGISVLNVDRRGAGGSGGVAQEAYFGPNGKWDAKAAYDFLSNHDCAFDPSKFTFVGASNGTTTALDFAVHANATAELSTPSALVFLTGGTYTEAQNRINDHRPLLDTLPILFVYSTQESGWSAQFVAGEGPRWMFHEYADGDHGTFMFVRRPDAIARVADFMQAALTP